MINLDSNTTEHECEDLKRQHQSLHDQLLETQYEVSIHQDKIDQYRKNAKDSQYHDANRQFHQANEQLFELINKIKSIQRKMTALDCNK